MTADQTPTGALTEQLARGFTAGWGDVKAAVNAGLPIALARHIAPTVLAALAEAEQKGAREALLAAADGCSRVTGYEDLVGWLRDRAAQIGGQP